MYYVTRHLERSHGFSNQDTATKKKRKISHIINVDTSSSLSIDRMNFIKKELQKYLLINCKPFSDADDTHIRAICPAINSGSLRADAIRIANSTREEIRMIIANSLFTRPSIDEWEDAKKRDM